jgi:hypothetical protein
MIGDYTKPTPTTINEILSLHAIVTGHLQTTTPITVIGDGKTEQKLVIHIAERGGFNSRATITKLELDLEQAIALRQFLDTAIPKMKVEL